MPPQPSYWQNPWLGLGILMHISWNIQINQPKQPVYDIRQLLALKPSLKQFGCPGYEEGFPQPTFPGFNDTRHCKDLKFVFCSTSTPHDCFCTKTVSILCNLLLVQCGASRSVSIKWEKGSIGFSLAWDNSELLCPTTWGEPVDEKKEGRIKKQAATQRKRDQRSRRDNQARDNRGTRDTADKPQNRIHSWDLEGFGDFSLCIWVQPSFKSLIRFYLHSPLCTFPEVTISNFTFKHNKHNTSTSLSLLHYLSTVRGDVKRKLYD